MKNKKAILFDFDGTLADTTNDLFLAWEKAFRNYGVEIKREDYFPLEGLNLIKIAKTIAKKYKIKIGINEVVNLKNQYYLENHCFSFYEGVDQLIDIIKEKGLLLAIVSASPKEKLEKTVPRKFLDKFNVLVTGDDATKGKPDPEPYLVAMEKLNLKANQCIVVENAPLGIKSAKSAGVYCIALTTTLEKEYLKEADKIFSSIKDLRYLFDKL